MIPYLLHILDTHASCDKDHILHFSYINTRRRPDKAPSNTNIQFFADNFTLWFPEPCSWWVCGGVLNGQFYVGLSSS